MDLSALSDSDLDALSRNDMRSVSDEGLSHIQQQSAAAPAPAAQEGLGTRIARGAINTIPALGAAAGGILSTPETLGAGTIPGAALGYAGGKEVADYLRTKFLGDKANSTAPMDQVQRVGGNLMEGASAEMGGQVIGAAANAAIPAAKALAGKVGKVAANIPEDVTARYIANPSPVRNAQSVDDLAKSVNGEGGVLDKLKQNVGDLSTNAWSQLSPEQSIPKSQVLQQGQDLIEEMLGGKGGQLSRQSGVGATGDKISAIQDQLKSIDAAYGDHISPMDMKSIVKDLQDTAYGYRGDPKLGNNAEGLRALSGTYNQSLKASNPAYDEAMGPVADATKNLQQMENTFVNRTNPDGSDKALNVIKNWGGKSDISSPKEAVSYADQNFGTNLGEQIQGTADKAQFDKTSTQGSRKTGFGAVVGGALGMLAHGATGAAEGAAAGAYAGQVADVYAGKMFQKALDTGIGLESFAGKLGPYTKVLTDASTRGPQALAATHYILQQQDQKYRERVNSIKGDDGSDK